MIINVTCYHIKCITSFPNLIISLNRENYGILFWQNGDRKVDCTSRPFLILNAYMQGGIAYDDNTQYQEAQIRNGSRKLISSQEVIADPFQLDGATKPTVDMTMEDLEKHFGHPVKITKKK